MVVLLRKPDDRDIKTAGCVIVVGEMALCRWLRTEFADLRNGVNELDVQYVTFLLSSNFKSHLKLNDLTFSS